MATLKVIASTAVMLGAVTTGLGIAEGREGNAKVAVQVKEQVPKDNVQPRPKDEFERTYILAEGENLRAFRPPTTELRIQHDLARSRRPRADGDAHSHSYFRWRKGTLEWIRTTTTGSGPELSSVFLPVLGMQAQEVEGDLKLMQSTIIGDFLIRDGVAPEVLVPELQKILRSDFGLPIKLVLGSEARTVIVASGRFRYTPAPGLDAKLAADGETEWIEVHARETDRSRQVPNGFQATGHLPGLLSDLARHTGLRVVDEVESGPKGFIGWRIADFKFPQPITEDDRKQTLEHLTTQTGLTFREAKRTVRVLTFEREQ